MLEAILAQGRRPLTCDDYILIRAYSGEDEIRFTVPRSDPAARFLTERVRVLETTTGQYFLTAGIDAGQREITYVLKKDLSDWEKTVYPGYTNGSAQATLRTTLEGVLPEGWRLVFQEEEETLQAYLTLEGPTPLGVAEQCMDVYGCALTYDNAAKEALVQYPQHRTPGTAFLVETANLRAAPEYKSKASGLVTRLYARGAEGLDFADINDGKPYVECFDYTDELRAGFWLDERYTIAEHLLAAAQERVKQLSQPERSWNLSVCDLYAVDPASWPGLRMELYDVVRLIDPTLGQSLSVQITELRLCPHHPERNEIRIESAVR